MTKELFFKAIIKYLIGVVLVGALIFIPAGTLKWINGWLFMGILFIPMLIAGIIMMFKNPKLLASRLDAKEKQKEQGLMIIFSGIMFIIGFVLAGLDFRFGWFKFPPWITYVACFIFMFAYLMWAEVLRENTFLARTIKVEENQKIVDTGLYGVIRHPMYLASILLFISMPLVLASLASLFVFMLYPILIVFRIINEEKFLEKELDGYKEYKEKVKYRLIPFIW